MKKTFLTLVAVGFGVSVSFAQTAPVQGTETEQSGMQTEQTDNMYQQEEGRTEVEMSEVPVAVQDAFKNGQYSNYEVLSIYEKEAEEGKKYEFELAQSGAAATEGQETAVEEGIAGVETERVSDRQADVIVYFDENGQVLEEKDPEEKKEDKMNSEY